MEVPAHLLSTHATLQRAYLAFCRAIAHAAVFEPGALPDLMESFKARYAERTAVEWQIASYDPQHGLFPDYER